MFNFKVSGIAAGAAFVISLLLGFLGGSALLVILLRAVLFAVVFFALCCVIFWLTGQFLPELMSGGPDDDLGLAPPGSRVNISVGSGALEGAFPTDTSDVVDSIDGKKAQPFPGQTAQSAAPNAPRPLDQGGNISYTGNAAAGVSAQAPLTRSPDAGSSQSDDGLPGDGQDLDLMPDFNNLSGDFFPQGGEEAETDETPAYETPESDRRQVRSTSSRGTAMQGDFNPQELARAIQTVLKKDDKA